METFQAAISAAAIEATKVDVSLFARLQGVSWSERSDHTVRRHEPETGQSNSFKQNLTCEHGFAISKITVRTHTKSMGRRRCRRQTSRFAVFSHSRFVDGIINDEKARADQKQYLHKAREIEEELLGRTIFVTNVLNLNKPENLEMLRRFMESTFGKVERCVRDKFRTNRSRNSRRASFPPARITFATKQAAERVFGGRALRESGPQRLTCSTVGHRGSIHVMPSRRYDGMLESALTGNSVSFESDGLSFGHWIPSFDDLFTSFHKASDEDWVSRFPADGQETFIEESSHPGPFAVRIDLYKRLIEITSSRLVEDDPLQAVWMSLLGLDETTEVLTVRFKELRNHVSVCLDDQSGKYFLVFSTKWPPRLELESLEGKRARQTCFGAFPEPVVGRCLGIKVSVSRSSISLILNHQSCDKLRNFGVLSASLRTPQDYLPVHSISVSARVLDALEIAMKDGLCTLARRSTRIGQS
jgi:hypothetical protein